MHSEFSMNTLFNNTQKNVQLFVNLWTIGHQALLSMDSIGKNTRVGCHTLLQGIFPTQGLNPCLFWISRWGFFVLFCFVFVFFFSTSVTWEAQVYTLFKCPYFLLLWLLTSVYFCTITCKICIILYLINVP